MNGGRVRIYELSRELNLDNKDILAICEQQNISVKSHSSTITDSEADRIRAAAEKQATSPSAPKPAQLRQTGQSQGSDKTKPVPIQKKQQILEIRKPVIRQISAPEPPNPPNQRVSQSTVNVSVPLAKPSTPSRPAHPAADGIEIFETPEVMAQQPSSVADSLEVDISLVDSLVVETPAVDTSEIDTSEIDTSAIEQPPQKPIAPPPPTPQAGLTEPPARPSATSLPRANLSGRPVLKKAQIDQAPQERKPVAERSPAAAAPASQGNARPRPSKPAEGRPTPRPQTIVELRRPPSRPTTDDESTKLSPAEASGDLILRGRPRPPQPGSTEKTAVPGEEVQLRDRPTLPSLPNRAKKGKNWQEEEEEEKLAVKVAPKNKRRTQPNLEDEEDVDLDLLDEEGEEDEDAPVQVSLSLVRPAKPKSQKQPQARSPIISVAPKPKKQGGFRDRRDRREQEVKPDKPELITLTGSLTVQELAALMLVPETEIIRSLFFKGIAANITQTLDIPTATMVAEEFDILVETGKKEAAARKITEMLDAADLDKLQRRPPVVTIMGHVDHGKTTLLDSIRKTKVAQGEAGGITQHIGAYHVDVEHNGEMQQVVFLDTPGHEAFTAMRARGARVTDIAVLVVAADDGVRPQTVEAISHAKAAKVPIVVAINKIDKEGAQPDRVKQELTEYALVPEEWGGETIMVPVSAINGENLDTLLEMLLLVAEVEDLHANPDRSARGTVIEAHLDKAKGPVATLLVQNGTLKVGDTLVAGSVLGKVRAMVSDRGDRVKIASPSFAVEVLGLSDVPAAGDEFEVFQDEKEARSLSSDRADEQRQSRLLQAMSSRRVSLNTLSARAQEGDLKELNLVLKADVQGSVEAILGALKQLPQNEVQVRVLYAAPGEVTETDVDLAAASSAVIIGFNTTLATGARQAADRAGVDVRDYNIIYKLLDDIQAAMEGLLEPELVEEPLGQAEVRAVFPVGKGAVAGCYVQSGKILRNAKIRVHRGNEVLHSGNLDSLKRMKEDVREVNTGFECGIGVDAFNAWVEGDVIEAYQMIAKRRTLSTK